MERRKCARPFVPGTACLIISSLIGFFLLFSQCRKKMTFASSDLILEFSRDTVRFDTVFTRLGSATRSFRIRNPYEDWVRIERIEFASGDSRFRMNVDGLQPTPVEDVEIPPEDSIYVFLEVTVDPDQPPGISPFIIRDSIQVTTGGGDQYVQLEAWGQNANYIPEANAGGSVSRLTCDMSRIDWDDPKPYVIWGVLLVDSCQLHIPEGTRVYVHGGVGRNENRLYNDGLIYTQAAGRLTIRGTKNEPVIIQGDRLEPAFDDVPGQWSGIRFGPTSGPHEIKHGIIRNAVNAIVLDSASDLRLEQSIVSNSASFGLFARRASVYAANVLFNDAGQHCVGLHFGGTYRFDYCTFAGYGVVSEALRMDNFTCYDPLCENRAIHPLQAEFVNCIIAGSSGDEIGLTDGTEEDESDFDYSFSHCLVTVDELLDDNQWPDFFEHCDNCLEYKPSKPLFRERHTFDYRLDSLSQVEGKGIPIPTLFEDLTGYPRDSETPDPGAYEYRPE